VVIVRCPLCGGWIVGDEAPQHLDLVHRHDDDRADWKRPAAPAVPKPVPNTRPARLCTHADEDGAGAHWLKAGELCGAGAQLDYKAAGSLLEELSQRRKSGQIASLGFQIYDQ